MPARRVNLFISTALFALVVLVFGRSVWFDWVRYDEGDYVYRSAAVMGGLSPAQIGWALTHFHASNWHPLTTISHMADVSAFGLNPGPMHAVNLFLHGLTTVGLFFALQAMTGARWRSALVAALFAIHPLRAESVAWIAERKDVLSGLFFAALLWAYSWYAKRPRASRYLLCLFLAAGGLMAKPMLVTIPFLLLLIDYWPLRRFETEKTARLLMEKIPFAALAGGVIVATLLAQRGAMATAPPPPALRLENAVVSYAIYLRQTFWPADLAALYPQPDQFYRALVVLGSLLLLVSLTAAFVLWRKRRPFLLAGWLWFLGMLVPVIGLVQVGRQAHADRYTYLPQIGLLIAIVWLGADFLPRKIGAVAGAVAVAILSVLCCHQVGYWQNAETLWPHTIAVTERNDGAHLAFATALISEGKTEAAMAEVRAATEIRPSNAGVFGEVPAVATKEEIDAGQEFWRARVADYPGDVNARINLGVLLARQHQAKAALAQWEEALRSDPADGNAQANISWVLATALDPSLRDGARAVRLAENITKLAGGMSPIVLRTLGAAYAENGRFEEATITAEKGRSLAAREGNEALARELAQMADRYRRHQPTRDATLSE